MVQTVIFIIGLPGSGKSTLAQTLENYVVHDDFISTYINGNVRISLESGENVCLIDPRLCKFETFSEYLETVLSIVPNAKIKLYLFENNIKQCWSNIRNRNKQFVPYKHLLLFNERYRLSNWKQYEHTIVPVYTPNID